MKTETKVILAALATGVGIALLGYLIGVFGVVLYLYTPVGGIVVGAGATVGLCFLADFFRKKLRARGLKTAVFLPLAYIPSAVMCAILWVIYSRAKDSGGFFAGLGEYLVSLGCSIACGLFMMCGVCMIIVEHFKSTPQG